MKKQNCLSHWEDCDNSLLEWFCVELKKDLKFNSIECEMNRTDMIAFIDKFKDCSVNFEMF